MPVTKVKTKWSSGNLQFLDSSGNIIATFDGANRKLTIPESSVVDFGKFMKVATGSLAAGNANAFAFAWQNPESAKIIIHKVIIDVTTAGGSATSVLDVGTAADGTTHSDNLVDGVDLNAVAVYDNIGDGGTNGKSKQKADENGGTTDYVTGQILTANAASLAGKYYIFYTVVA